MAVLTGTTKQAPVVVDRSKLPQTIDAVAVLRTMAGCKGNDNVVELVRHTAASGSEVYSANAAVQMSGYKLQVSCNFTVIGTKTATPAKK